MNREQMENWLILEGWSPVDNDRTPVGVRWVRWISVMRGENRIQCNGDAYTPSSWAEQEKEHVSPENWSAFTEPELRAIYGKARLL